MCAIIFRFVHVQKVNYLVENTKEVNIYSIINYYITSRIETEYKTTNFKRYAIHVEMSNALRADCVTSSVVKTTKPSVHTENNCNLLFHFILTTLLRSKSAQYDKGYYRYAELKSFL